MAAHYGGITAWIWKKVSHFDYDKYWKMREYVTSHRGGVKAYYYLYQIKKVDASHMALTFLLFLINRSINSFNFSF